MSVESRYPFFAYQVSFLAISLCMRPMLAQNKNIKTKSHIYLIALENELMVTRV